MHGVQCKPTLKAVQRSLRAESVPRNPQAMEGVSVSLRR